MELPTWPKKVDPWLQRTAWMTTATLGILALITKVIIPYYEAFLIVPYLALAAWYAYSWHKDRNFLGTWWIQYAIATSMVPCFVWAYHNFALGDGYHVLVSSLWFLTGSAWVALSVRAAYEKYVFLWGFLATLVLTDEMQQKILHRLQGVEYNEDFGQALRTDMQKAIELMPPSAEPVGSEPASRWGQTEFQVNLKLGLTLMIVN